MLIKVLLLINILLALFISEYLYISNIKKIKNIIPKHSAIISTSRLTKPNIKIKLHNRDGIFFK